MPCVRTCVSTSQPETSRSPMLRSTLRQLLEVYIARVPYHRGKWRIVDRILSLTGLEDPDRGRVHDVERAGLRWRLNPDCAVQRRLLYHGMFDIHDIRALLVKIGPESVFLDIGSYFGFYGMLAAQRGARVFAFEPVPVNFQLLSLHRELNHVERLQAFQLAMSDAEGEVAFALPSDDNRGTGRMKVDASDDKETVRVAATTLDQFARYHSLDRLDAFKLDVEGSELQVLAGGRATIERFRPVMLIELNPPCLARFGSTAGDLMGVVRGLGYDVFRPTSRGLVPFEQLEPGESYTNILCLPRK
ncbi:MAG: FkbM family methyltransferase [Verrucomicrobiaceae bacterium]|nr:MAG: FkbM family methyltransferase [Verrucomicrobiaceae bacterium]